MKTDLLWNRFLCYWLPADEVQDGDIEANIDRAFNRTYTQVNGKNAGFTSIRGGGSAIITASETVVATKAEPATVLPSWIVRRPYEESYAAIEEARRAFVASPQAHIILKAGRTAFQAANIVVGGGSLVVVNEPGKTVATDAVRVARARRAFHVLGSPTRAEQAKKLVAARVAMTADTAEIDKNIRKLIAKAKLTQADFFDAVDLLDGVTPPEMKIARTTT